MGDELVISNSSLLVYYKIGDSKSVVLTEAMVSDFQTNSVGNFTYTITYEGFSVVVNYTVSKGNPTYDIPILNDIEFVEGMVLGDITLPEGFSWNNPDTLLSEGNFTYLATFTPIDTINYNIITNISINVNVIKYTTPILIYEVYGGGGNSGAIYNQDYIVLYNTTNSDIILSNYSVQYFSGTSYNVITLSGTIYSKNYYLIGLSSGVNGEALPVGVNLTSNNNLSLADGKIALVKGTNVITSINDVNIIDFLGFGSVDEFEGTKAPSTSNTTSIKRNSFIDTDNNFNDFSVSTPNLEYLVNSLNPVHIEAFNIKNHYSLSSSLDIGGSYLVITYSNGSFKTVDITSSMVSGFNSTTVGQKTLEINYLGLATTYEYYIVDYSNSNEVNVYYIDIGASGGNAGEASFIKVGNIDVLIDAGDDDSKTESELLQFLGTQVTDGVIEYVIATHPDSDHIGGMMEVFNNYQVDSVVKYSTDSSTTSSIRTNFEASIVSESSTIYDAYTLATSTTPYISLSSGVNLKFYDTSYLKSTSTNASSIVFVLEAFDTRVLFNGDSESNQESVYAPLVRDVDIFKMGHHGSTNGTSTTLLEIIKPEVAIVSNGNYLGNGYNHPTYNAVSRIYQYSNAIPVYSVTGGNGSGSDISLERNGDINIAINNNGYNITSQKYGNNPLELSKTSYWNNSSNTYKNYSYYYKDVTGIPLNSDIKTTLHDLIDDHTTYSYTQAWEILKKTDEDPNNPNNVILFYTGRSQLKTTNGGAVDEWNREHVWAKSHGGFGETAPAGSDIHHLRPTDVSVNSTRGSLDFDYGGTKVNDVYGPGSSFSYVKSGVSFEPRDEVKGDVARIIFYMAVRYEGDKAGEPNLELNDIVNNGTNPYMGRVSVLLEWNKLDPVDDFERNRNNVIYSYQKNRNPFIDNPKWADIIFSN